MRVEISGDLMAKADYWSRPDVLESHAKKRRDRYASDPEYAKAERDRARKAYLERTGRDLGNPARDAIPRLVDEETYTCHTLSEMLGRRRDYIQRMILKGLWPDPRDQAEKAKGSTPHFNGRTAKALFKAFADHLDHVSTYRADHTDTTKALFDAYRRTI